MRVLLIKPSSLGDVIHALPVAHALRRAPGVEALDWVIRDDLAGWLEGNADVDRVIRFPRKRWGALGRFVAALRSERYEWIVDLQGLLRSGLMARGARGRRRIGLGDAREGAGWWVDERVPVEPGEHAVHRYLRVVTHLGVASGPLQFPLPERSYRLADQAGEGFIAIHPYARWPTKQLPGDWVRGLVARLAPRRVVLVGQGEALGETGALDLTNQSTPAELLGLLERAAAVISSDSGPMHLAAALGRPLVAVFGPTEPRLTGPWTANARVVRHEGLPCAPCMARECAWREERACLRGIAVGRVAEALAAVEGRTPDAAAPFVHC